MAYDMLLAPAINPMPATAVVFGASGQASQTFTGTTTALSATVSVANTTGLGIGMVVSGPGITTGTKITAISANVSVTLNAPATSSTTGGTFTARPIPAQFTPDAIVSGAIATTQAYASAAASSAASAAASAASAVVVTGTLPRVNRSALKALDTNTITVAWCTEAGREGMFHWRAGNYASSITADTVEGIYIKANAVGSSSGAWVRAWDGPVMASWFGAVGDGSTDDTAALQIALTISGSGATIMLDAGLTYLVSSALTMLTKQRLIGAATLKRRNQITTTTTGAMTSGVTTSVTVASTTGLAVGMQVAFAQSGTSRASLVLNSTLSASRTITNISGSTLTFSAAPSCNLSSGSTVFLAFPTLTVPACAVVDGVVFDGNRSNWSYNRWEVMAEVWLNGATAAVFNCTFNNAPAEVCWQNADYTAFSRNRISNAGGNGVHLSGCNFPVVDQNAISSCNLDLPSGHQDGGIIWSDSITHATVAHNYVTGCLAGLGSFDSTDTDATVLGNTITGNKVWGMYCGGSAARLVCIGNRFTNNQTDTSLVSGLGYPNTGGILLHALTSTDFVFQGNQVDETGHTAIYAVGSGGTALRLNIDGNQILGGVLVAGVSQWSVSNNKIKGGGIKYRDADGCRIADNLIDLQGDTSTYGIDGYGGYIRNACIEGNTVLGGIWGIVIDDGPTEITNTRISNNTVRGQSSRAIIVDNATATVTVLDVAGNTVYISSDSVIGIMVRPSAADIRGNTIYSTAGGSSRTGIYVPAALSSSMGNVISENGTRGPFANDINVPSNAGVFVLNNRCHGTVTSSTGNTVSGTVAI